MTTSSAAPAVSLVRTCTCNRRRVAPRASICPTNWTKWGKDAPNSISIGFSDEVDAGLQRDRVQLFEKIVLRERNGAGRLRRRAVELAQPGGERGVIGSDALGQGKQLRGRFAIRR